MNISFPTTPSTPLAPLVSERPSAPALQAATLESLPEKGDQVSLRPQARLLEEHEVDNVLQESMAMIESDPFSALHAHGGLDPARVAALLA